MKSYYTYKVTFPGFKWFYFGVHKDNGKPYFGSPKTHKRVWALYECEVQILEWFDTMEEAHSLEQRLIRPFLNHPHCLNERCGGNYSEEHQKRAGLRSFELKVGAHSLSQAERSWHSAQGGRIAMKNRLEQDPTCQARAGKIAGDIAVSTGQLDSIRTAENQTKGRETCKKLGIGVFNPASREKAGRSTSRVRHECPCCGKVSTPGGIGRHISSSSNNCKGPAIALPPCALS
jgi:hypothetical protein